MKLISLVITLLLLTSCVQNTKLITEKGEKKAKLKYHVLKDAKEVKHGLYKSYYKDGTLTSEGNYHNDKREGVWTYYDLDGDVSEVYKYQNGTILRRTQYKKGILIYISNYEFGKIKLYEEFEEDGSIRSTSFYENGELIKTEKEVEILEYFESKKVIITYDKQTGKRKDVKIKMPLLKYPPIAVENNIPGKVVYKITSKGDCTSLKIEPIEPSKYKFYNNAAKLIVEEYVALIKKYDPQRCTDLEETIPLIYKID